jgi:uncharacterized membrane protein YdbT with pleckstrin-like domain
MLRYVNSVLVKGEHIVYSAKLHWKIYFTLKALCTLWISPFIQQATSEFVITNKRVIIKLGIISRKTLEMNLHKIESVNVEQGMLARLLGYGTITIIGTGGTRESFADIADPLMFRRKFQEFEAVPDNG